MWFNPYQRQWVPGQAPVGSGIPTYADPLPEAAANPQYPAPAGTNIPIAKLDMPSNSDLGSKGWGRVSWYPTAPFIPLNPNVGVEPRDYGATLLSTDTDYVVGGESIRTVQFDIPCALIVINGSCRDQTTPTNLAGLNPLDFFLFRLEYTTGNRLQTAARLARTVIGTGERPGEVGGYGWNIDQGASVTVGLTPLAANLRIDITLRCVEKRGPTNFSRV